MSVERRSRPPHWRPRTRLPSVIRVAALSLGAAMAACTAAAPADWTDALLEPRVPRAVAGDPSWIYAQRARADLDADGAAETAVLISDVMLDTDARPLWEDGHRWQVYVEEADGARTYLYAKFLPNGTLLAELTRGADGRPTVTLLERSPEGLSLYELRYDAPDAVAGVARFARPVDPGATFQGAPRP